MALGDSDSRVVITGLGVVSPHGRTRRHWNRVIAGERAVRWLTDFNPATASGAPLPAGWSQWFGAPARGFETTTDTDVVAEMALAAAEDAVESAGLRDGFRTAPERRGCVLGVSKPLVTMSRTHDGASTWNGWADLASPAEQIAQRYELRAAALVPSAACATGLISLIRGVDLIREGVCDTVLAGGSDWSLTPAYLAAYRRLGVLAKAGQDPAVACRPFDRHRTGFAVGCGAAVLVLERLSHARDRDAPIEAEWLGHALAGDASSMVDVDVTGATPARVITDALRRSRIEPDQLEAASLHGTATRANDLCETAALHSALGSSAGALSCFSLKGGIGHLMGAAGAVETATLALALRHGIVPPTTNLNEPDPDCDLDYTPLKARPRALTHGLKLSLGFGGACAAAVLRSVR
jgi:3-oxoacyl-(acyl-carrier-protein) synthase